MPTFTSADRVGAIGGYIGGISALLGGNCGNGGVLNGVLGNRGDCGCYVTEKEMCLIRENATLIAEKYTDNKLAANNLYWQEKYEKLADKECSLETALAMECERRACGDENIITFVKGNYIPAEKVLNSRNICYHACRPVLEHCDTCSSQQ